MPASFVLLCCFVRKGGRGPGEREKRQRAGNAGKGKERREACSHPFPLPILPSAPTIIQKFPIGSLCRGERVSLVLHCASLLRTIFASLARGHERVHVQNVRDFPKTKLDSVISAHFLLNEHGDPHFLFYKFNENNVLNN